MFGFNLFHLGEMAQRYERIVRAVFEYYHKDRLNNSVFLSPSLCTKRSILLGRQNSTNGEITASSYCSKLRR